MSNNQMICEANTSLPKHVDIDVIRNSNKPYFAAQEQERKTVKDEQLLSEVQAQYNVLPKYEHRYDYLNSILSLKDNQYLLCKWYQFLGNVPDHYIKVRLFADLIVRKPQTRKMNLNGQFYGVDNKLAPIPNVPDPRHYNQEHANALRKQDL